MMDWFSRHHDREWASAVERCLGTTPTFFPAIHPDRDIPYLKLQQLTAGVVDDAPILNHPDVRNARELLHEAEPYDATVPIGAIKGMGNASGRFAFDLARLPEEMGMQAGESFGPLDHAEGLRLWHATRRELDAFDPEGRIRLVHQEWDDCYIVRNSGAAHRFALWWRLQQYVDLDHRCLPTVRTLEASVTPYRIDERVLNDLLHRSRMVFCVHDPTIAAAIELLHAIEPGFLYVMPGGRYWQADLSIPATIFIPHLGTVPARRAERLVKVHRWADRLFDLGRYIAERSATYRSGFR